MLIVVAFGMTYTARGGYTFENLRALGWYHAIPQLGAVLVAAGWWSRRQASPAPARAGVPSLRELSWGLALVVVLLLLQRPRANRVLFEYDGAAAPSGGELAAAGRSSGPASRADLATRARAQRRVLERLDRLEEIARSRGIGRSDLRRVLGKVIVPGMPGAVADLDGLAAAEDSRGGNAGRSPVHPRRGGRRAGRRSTLSVGCSARMESCRLHGGEWRVASGE